MADTWGDTLTLPTGRTVTLRPEPGVLVEHAGDWGVVRSVTAMRQMGTVKYRSATSSWDYPAGSMKLDGHNSPVPPRDAMPLLPAGSQLSDDPAERQQEVWALLRINSAGGGSDLFMHNPAGAVGLFIKRKMIRAYPLVYGPPNGLCANLPCVTDPATLELAANRLSALQTWLAGVMPQQAPTEQEVRDA